MQPNPPEELLQKVRGAAFHRHGPSPIAGCVRIGIGALPSPTRRVLGTVPPARAAFPTLTTFIGVIEPLGPTVGTPLASEHPVHDEEIVAAIGYPVLVKAAAAPEAGTRQTALRALLMFAPVDKANELLVKTKEENRPR